MGKYNGAGKKSGNIHDSSIKGILEKGMEWQGLVPILNIPFNPTQDGHKRNFKELERGVRDWQKRASAQWHDRRIESQRYRVFTTPFVSNAKPFLFFQNPGVATRLGVQESSPLVKVVGEDKSGAIRQRSFEAIRQPFIQQPLLYERAGGNQFSRGPGLSVVKPNPAPPFMDASNEYELVKKVRFIETQPQYGLKKAHPATDLPGPRRTILRRRKEAL